MVTLVLGRQAAAGPMGGYLEWPWSTVFGRIPSYASAPFGAAQDKREGHEPRVSARGELKPGADEGGEDLQARVKPGLNY